MAEFEICVLDNGIRIIHQETPHSNVAHMGIMINAGSRDEEEDEHGLAHFIEHVIFKGTTKRKAHQILSRLDAVGGELNAYTTKEDTVVYASFLSHHYDRATELICDIISNSIFPPKELEKEKEVIIDEINSYLDSPSEQIFDDFESLIFKNHPVGNNVLGTIDHLKKFNSTKVKNFIKKHYTTNNMVFSSVGPASSDQVFNMVKKYLGHIKPSTNSKKKSKVRKVKPVHTEIEKDVAQTHKLIGSKAYQSGHKHKTTLTLLTNYLGGPAMNARLNMEIREKYGYTYNIEANYSTFSDTGLFSVYFGTDPKYAPKVESLIYKEFNKLRDKTMSSRQLNMAKQQLIGQIGLSQESKVSLMLAIGKSLLLYDRVDSLDTVYKKINKITEKDILEVANHVFHPDQLNSLSFIPKH